MLWLLIAILDSEYFLILDSNFLVIICAANLQVMLSCDIVITDVDNTKMQSVRELENITAQPTQTSNFRLPPPPPPHPPSIFSVPIYIYDIIYNYFCHSHFHVPYIIIYMRGNVIHQT